MLLKDIQQDTDMRATVDKLKLMRREFKDDDRIACHLVHYLKNRNTDISNEKRLPSRRLKKMMYQGRCSAFPFCASDANYLRMKRFKEQICLRRYLTNININVFQ